MRASKSPLGPVVVTSRMVQDYVEALYEPSAAQAGAMEADGYARAREVAAWKARVRETWSDVEVINVEGDVTAAEVGEERQVAATVRLGRLSTDDVAVQLARGLVGANGEIVSPELTEMHAGPCTDGVY